MRNLIVAAAVVGMAGLSPVGLAGTAVAAEAVPTFTQATNSYSSPSTQSVRMFSFAGGEHVRAVCITVGEEIGGNLNWIGIARNGTLMGFLPKSAISGVPENLQYC